jgi:hypothetical protein
MYGVWEIFANFDMNQREPVPGIGKSVQDAPQKLHHNASKEEKPLQTWMSVLGPLLRTSPCILCYVFERRLLLYKEGMQDITASKVRSATA